MLFPPFIFLLGTPLLLRARPRQSGKDFDRVAPPGLDPFVKLSQRSSTERILRSGAFTLG